jgi:hypothetical protein
MILKDNVRDLVLTMDVFMTKRGRDLEVQKKLIRAINMITGEDSLDAIYVNNNDQFNIPDVTVLPIYHKDFSIFLMDGDMSDVCPFGYTIEIHERVFDKLNPEELSAVIIHDILQNVQSCTAKTRFMKAYNSIVAKYKNEDILNLFDDISTSEVMFMAYCDICMRPFRVPVSGTDYVGTDEVLKGMGLGDAYDSYLQKVLPMSNDTPEDHIVAQTKADYRTMRTIIRSCMDKDIRYYYTVVRNGVPLVSLENIFAGRATVSSLGFISRKREFKHQYTPRYDAVTTAPLQESFINPRSEVELRFQVDKIIADMRYAESESEREVILIKIKNLVLKLTKVKIDLEKKLEKNPQDASIRSQYETTMNLLDELEMLRQKTVKMEIKEKKYGIWVQYPKGYTD